MSQRRTFLVCLCAYLTGWVIAQSIFQRLVHYALRHGELKRMDEFAERIAKHLSRELRAR